MSNYPQPDGEPSPDVFSGCCLYAFVLFGLFVLASAFIVTEMIK
jgi:hypothetical protein